MIDLKSKIEEVFSRLTSQFTNFSGLHKQNSKTEMIVLFLAILHLLKEQLVCVEQNSHFEEMVISKKMSE